MTKTQLSCSIFKEVIYSPFAFLTANVTVVIDVSRNLNVTGTDAPGFIDGAGFMHIRW